MPGGQHGGQLRRAGADFGNLAASGSVSTSGAFSLDGSAALTIDGFASSSASFTLNSAGLCASADVNLNYGALDISLDNLRISAAGISFTACLTVDSGWDRVIDVPFIDQGDTYGRFRASLCLTVAPNGNITATVSGTLAAWVVTVGGPGDISETPFRVSQSASISSSGYVCISHTFAGINWANWCFDLW